MELSILELTNKEQIDVFVEKKVNECLMGDINPLALKNQLKMIEVALDKINEQTKDMQLSEARKYGAKSFDAYNSKIEIAELGTKYDYTVCNDPEMNDLLKEEDDLKKRKKERETFLKAIKGSQTIVHKDTGEIVEVYPPNKTSTTGLKVTLK